MEHELPEVLDGVDEPVTVEELEAVVRRAGQRRRASLVAGAAGLLLCGAVGGALAQGGVDDRSTGFASSEATTPPARGMAMAPGSNFWGPLTQLFRREANGVAIRAYRSAPLDGQPGPLAANGCKGWGTVHGELSNSAAVGFAPAQDLPGDTFLLLSAGKFGQAEGEPATWATVRTGAGVATAQLTLGAATDSMAPQAGIALLAVPGDGGNGVVEGLDGEGKVVATQELKNIAHPPPDPACSQPCEVVKPGTPAQVEPAKPGQDPTATLPQPPPTFPDPPVTTSSDSPVTTLAAPPMTLGPDPAGKGAVQGGIYPCAPVHDDRLPYPIPSPAPAAPAAPPSDRPSGAPTATTAVLPPPPAASSGKAGATTSTLAPPGTAPPLTAGPTTTSAAGPAAAP